jgi:hypothetical protein
MRCSCSWTKRNILWGRQQRHVCRAHRRFGDTDFIEFLHIIIIAITTTTSTTATTNTTTTTTTTSTAKFYCKFYQQLHPTHLCVAIFCQHIRCVHVTTLKYFPLYILAISSRSCHSCRCFTTADVPHTLIVRAVL